MKKDEVYEALTVQALQMMHEVFRGAGMSQDVFVKEYLSGLGDYERRIARKHGISIPARFRRVTKRYTPAIPSAANDQHMAGDTEGGKTT